MYKNLNITHGDLSTGRTRLVPVSPVHVDELFCIYSDYDVIRFTDNNLHLNKSDTRDFIANLSRKYELNESLCWAIELAGSRKIIGTVTLYHIDRKHYFASIGCLLSKEYWRLGYMSEVLRKILSHSFDVILLNRLEAQIFVGHDASVNLFEKLRFTREAVLRENFLIERKLENSYMYSMVKSDYLKLQV